MLRDAISRRGAGRLLAITTDVGLHLTVRLERGVLASAVVDALAEQDVGLEALDTYAIDDRSPDCGSAPGQEGDQRTAGVRQGFSRGLHVTARHLARMVRRFAALGLAPILVLTAAAGPTEPALKIAGGSILVVQRGAVTALVIRRNGRSERLTLPQDDGISPGSLGVSKIVGDDPGRLIVLSSAYASRPTSPQSACGAGTEVMLRVIALLPRPRQTFHQLLASCWRTMEAGEVAWDGTTRRLVVERTTFDSQPEQHLRTHYTIGDDGTPTLIRIERLP